MAVDDATSQASSRSKAYRMFLTYRLHLLAAVSLLIFTLVAISIYRLTQEVRYEEVLSALSETPWYSIALAGLFTALSYFALIGYDVNALEYIGRKVPFPSVFVTAFMAYAVGNTVGFGPISGGAIRLRAYSRLGLSPGDIAKIIAFVTLSFGLGLLCVSALASLAVAPRVASIIGLDALWLRLIAVCILIVVFGLFFAAGNGRIFRVKNIQFSLPDSRTASRQFLVTTLDIAASSSVLYVLLPETHLGWPTFFAIYAVAIGAGVISHVPAGLGVFEAVILAGLSHAISIDQLLGSLVLYRCIYYLFPLILAGLVLLLLEVRHFIGRPVVVDAVRLAERLSPFLIATMAMIVGSMLVLSSIIPTPIDDLAFLNQFLPLPFIETAHFVSSLLGLCLIVSARGLGQGIDGAWWVAVLSASIALALIIFRAIGIYEAILLIGLLMMLVMNADNFRRHASLFSQALEAPWIASIAVIILAAVFILFFIYRDTQYVHELWWQFELSEDAPRSLRALLGISIAGAAIALFGLLRPARLCDDAPSEDVVARASAVVAMQGNADGNLVRMGDKRILFSETGNSFIMYGAYRRSWIALADPIGDEDEFPDLVWQFLSNARAAGCRAAFYQVSSRLLSIYADVGLRAFKLGELAFVDLDHFELKGSRFANLRQAFNKGQRDGLSFELLEPNAVTAILPRLRVISDEWLEHHKAKEKAFSLGNFTDHYVLSQPVCVAYHQGEIVAFATLMLTDTKEDATVDLMRFSNSAPKGSMDFLFLCTLEYLKQRGFQRFELGMAPLSGMLKHKAAPIWDRIGSTIFEHGDRFYNFKGLRAFKSKFHPNWEPRYLAVANTATAGLVLMDVTFLIGGGVKGMVSK